VSEPGGPPIIAIVSQHVDEAASLRRQRTRLVRAPHIRLNLLRRHDERIAAHLDGVVVAGEAGRELARAAAAENGTGEVFTAAVIAIGSRDLAALEQMTEVARRSSDAARALVSATGWVSARDVRPLVKDWLGASDPDLRGLALGACAMHGVDPGAALRAKSVLGCADALAASSIDTAGRLARMDLLGACLTRLEVGDPLRFRAAAAALLLGERRLALEALQTIASEDGEEREAALEYLVLALEPTRTLSLLRGLAREPSSQRAVIRCAGTSGQTEYVPWLLEKCAQTKTARIAAEAICVLTGLDLEMVGLAAPRPGDAPPGASDETEDGDLELDPDEDLPWPDASKLEAWWSANRARFHMAGRWFCGQALTTVNCESVLRTGHQRQRRLAALHRTLASPGTPLFSVAAPAWRQQRRLG
jgi:uncharacterized protein (TIGR02270 family)